MRATAVPTARTNPKTSIPNSRRKHRANAPAATRAAVSRADARSSVSRQSVVSHFTEPARSAWPGRGRCSGGVAGGGAGGGNFFGGDTPEGGAQGFSRGKPQKKKKTTRF